MRYRNASVGVLVLGSFIAGLCVPARAAGDSPPGPPGSAATRMPSLRQIEPRTIVESLPYTVTNAGSYVLVSNLRGTNGQDGIVINVDDVTVDLNGFSLIGVSGSQVGIRVSGAIKRVHIRNGRIRQWGGSGIDANQAIDSTFDNLVVSTNGHALNQNGARVGTGCSVSDSVFLGNKFSGLNAGDQCTIRRCTARRNTSFGISSGDNCSIRDCLVSQNGASGIYAYVNSTLNDCSAFANGGHGFYVKQKSIVAKCTAGGNTNNGFNLSKGAVISDCTANGNENGFQLYGALCHNCTALENREDGFHCYLGYSSLVRDCTSESNGQDGIDANSGSRISDCLVSGHTNNIYAGIAAGAQSHITGNTCRGNYHGISERGAALIRNNFVTMNTYGIQSGGTHSSLIIGNIATSNTNNIQTTADQYGPMAAPSGSITNTNPYLNITF